MTDDNCPAVSSVLAMTVSTELAIVMVPALDLPTRVLQFGAERSMYAPPSMKRPVIISVGPGFKIGSPGGGPGFTEPEQRGLTETVTTRAT